MGGGCSGVGVRVSGARSAIAARAFGATVRADEAARVGGFDGWCDPDSA
jgi:hypothetical protein